LLVQWIKSVRRFIHRAFLVGIACHIGLPARADSLSGSYTELTAGTTTDLTATGTVDWIKFGNGENDTTSFLNTTKIGNPIFLPATLEPLGTAPSGSVSLIAFTGQGNLNFTWGNGNFGMYNDPGPVDTVVGETIVPAVSSYPTGLGASFQANAINQAMAMDVYVQGFDANTLITASLSGGKTTSTLVVPSQTPPSDPSNQYALGDFHVVYSGAGETLTISVQTQDPRTSGLQNQFASAGFFGAAVTQLLPGDLNNDGIVNGQDIAIVASNWLQQGTPGSAGDANVDGIVNGEDIAVIASNWLSKGSGGGAGSGAAVPEPSTLILAAVGFIGLAMVSCRHRRN
jgi:hypothetical protein